MEKHLDYIENTINRMANNSFLIKGWCITFISLLFVLGVRDSDIAYLILALLPLICFWALDAYYLRQEKLYRKLYDAVRTGAVKKDYSMNANKFKKRVKNLFFLMFSSSIWPLYFTIILLNILLQLFIVIGVI